MSDMSIPSMNASDGANPLQQMLTGRAKALQAQSQDAAHLDEAAKGFESVLLNILMNEMQNTIPESDFLSDGTSRQVQGMFWQFLSEEMSNQGGIGLAKQFREQFARMADPQPEPPSTIETLE